MFDEFNAAINEALDNQAVKWCIKIHYL
jgi:hypothetical protein